MNADSFDEIKVLIKDLRNTKSDVVRDFVEAEILKRLDTVRSDIDPAARKPVQDVVTEAVSSAKPVYFDLWTKCDTCDIAMKVLLPADTNSKRKVLEHVYSPELVRVDSDHETVIRSYDKQNNVVYENGRLAGLCPNYTERLRKALGEVQKAIAEGKAGLTSRFDEQTPEYAKSPEKMYSDDEIAKVDTPMVNPSNPLEPIDDDERMAVTKTAKHGKTVKKTVKKTVRKHAARRPNGFSI